MKKELGTFVLLVVLCVVVAILQPQFLSSANLQNMARQIGMYGIFSLGIGIVIITGGIDLSVGSVFALLGVLLSLMLTEWVWPAALVVVIIIGIAMAIGALHGLLITKLRIQPFIVTLCGLLFYRGLARFIANDETKGLGGSGKFDWLRELATGVVLGIPMPAGIRLLSARAPQMLSWAWGMNGALSVVGATLAIFIAMNWGFTTTMFVASATYLIAFAALQTLKGSLASAGPLR